MHAQVSIRPYASCIGIGGHVGFFTQPESMKEFFQIPVEFATEADYIWKIF
jgi:hypothetical protein